MAFNFLSLPSELKLQISEWLNYQDHYQLATACHQNWVFFQDIVQTKRMQHMHKHLVAKMVPYFAWSTSVAEVLALVLREHHFRTHTKSLRVLDTPNLWCNHFLVTETTYESRGSSGTMGRQSELELSPVQISHSLDSYDYCDSSHTLFDLAMALIISLPNLEELAVEGVGAEFVLEGLMTRFYQTPKVLLELFQHLTHLQFSPRPSNRIHYRLVHQFAQLPQVRRIGVTGIEVDAFTAGDYYRRDRSNVQELYFSKALLNHAWLEECLPMYHGLRRFDCTFEKETIGSYTPRAILKALLQHASKTLLSVHLRAFPTDSYGSPVLHPENHPYLSLKHFEKLQILRCEWDAIVPEESFESRNRSDDEFPTSSGRLFDILPDSLVILQLNYAKDEANADERLVEYLNSKPSKLRRLDWNCPSQALRDAADILHVELHPVVSFEGWSCAIGCPCDWQSKQEFGISMPPESDPEWELSSRPGI